jgi:CheY-like chemotaxis protein
MRSVLRRLTPTGLRLWSKIPESIPAHVSALRVDPNSRLRDQMRLRRLELAEANKKLLETKLESLRQRHHCSAHDFNRALTGILASAEIALRQLGDETALRECLHEIRRAVAEGAAVARRLVEEDEKGVGERPAIAAPSDAVPEPARAAFAPGLNERQGARGRLLLVDDDSTARLPLRRLLEDAGYEVVAAGTLGEARRIASKDSGKVDLLLTDLFVEDGRGTELAEQLRETRLGLPVLYVSGAYPYDPHLTAALQHPRTAFVSKPVDFAALLGAIDELVGTGTSAVA